MLNFAKILGMEGFEKRSFFKLAIWIFFLNPKKSSQSSWVARMGLGPTLMHRTVLVSVNIFQLNGGGVTVCNKLPMAV